MSDKRGRRGARIPPHSAKAARRVAGLEAAVIDNAAVEIRALSPTDTRIYTAKVAGPAALVVAKLHKLGERQATPHRLVDKDAHDIYRLLVAVPTKTIAGTLHRLRSDPLAGSVTTTALTFLETLFAAGPAAIGSKMAGRAEEGVGDPDVVAASVSTLARDILSALP